MYERARDYSQSALSALGLQPRRTATDYLLPALGVFGFGVLVGVGVGLMFARKPGAELRGDIGRKMRRVRRAGGQHEQGAADGFDELSVDPSAH